MIGVYITHCIGIVHHTSSFDLFNTLLGQLGRGPVRTVSGIMLLVDQKRQHMMQQRAATRIRNALIIHLNPFNQEKTAFFSRRQARVHQVQPRLGPGALPEIVGTDSSQLLRNEVRAAGWIWIYIKTART